MNHILDLEKQEEKLNNLFTKIYEGNTILFLGAGASVGEKKYLSKEIIEYYESYMGQNLNEPDITRFVDILSADQNFSRAHFDTEVAKMLVKYQPNEGHRIVSTIQWREIITTNYDLLIEKAFDEIKTDGKTNFDLVPVREHKDYNYRTSNSEIKYIKLNGCLSDKRKYPLVFSSDDFKASNRFYKIVLNDLKSLSDRISLISCGYSFQDPFGRQLLEKFDSYNFRERKWIYNVDPFPNENALPYYSQNKICIIKCSFEEFFKKYQAWLDSQLEAVVRKKRISFRNSKSHRIQIPHKLAMDLENSIRQLDSESAIKFIKDVDFYRGEEPNFDIIRRGVDVIKKSLFQEVSEKIEENINGTSDAFLPIFFLKGDFGIGKSTFTLRLISELSKREDLELIAFEVLDFISLKTIDLVQLFSSCNSKNIILYCDELEVESSFKAMIELRRELSIEQFNDFNVFFLVPIRENILEKYKRQRTLRRIFEIKVTANFTDDEISELLTKLKNVGIVQYRDASEKKQLLDTIKNVYQNDSFISLLQLVTDGKHINDLVTAYNELSRDVQKAFLYTALLHQFKLHMPVSWLRSIISSDWDDFVENIVKAEGKGILIQESVDSYGVTPDLFFRTKHPIIATELIKRIEPNKDKQYKLFQRMFNSIEIGSSGSYWINNLLKTLSRSGDYSDSKIDKLHDLAFAKLSDDPHYLLNYCINLQKRKGKTSLKKALDLLIYAESLLQYRNHRFIHRRAVINFELAKLLYEESKEYNVRVEMYLQEAKELFNVKQLLDPFSAYSYSDYVRFLIWEMKNLSYEDEDVIAKRITIEELLELAEKTVTEDVNRILELKAHYVSIVQKSVSVSEYKQYLDDLYEDFNLRPYSCILLYKFYEENEDTFERAREYCEELVDEMTNYSDNNEVVKFLAKYYGRKLYIANNRVNFFTLCRKHSFLEEEIPLRFYYFNFIAESYDLHFHEGRQALKKIKGNYNGLNPTFHYVWSDSDGDEIIFDAIVGKWFDTKYKAVKITNFQQHFKLVKGNYEKYNFGQKVKVKLHFYLYGIIAEIVED